MCLALSPRGHTVHQRERKMTKKRQIENTGGNHLGGEPAQLDREGGVSGASSRAGLGGGETRDARCEGRDPMKAEKSARDRAADVFRDQFLTEYLIHGGNATAAWRKLKPHIGAKVAQVESSRYLSKPMVSARLEEMRIAAQNELRLTRAEWLGRLKLLAFGSLSDVLDLETKAVKKGVMDTEARHLISEMRLSDKGITFKAVDSKAALMDLGEALGFFNRKLTLKPWEGATPSVIVVGYNAECDPIVGPKGLRAKRPCLLPTTSSTSAR